MAAPQYIRQIRERREQERQRALEEQRREEALERRRQEDRERERENERRREALQQANEFETVLEQARQRRHAVLDRLRTRQRAERRREERATQRRAELVDAARAERRQEARAAEQEGARAEMRHTAAGRARLEERRDADQVAAQAEERRAAARQARQEEARAAEQEGARAEMRRTAAGRARSALEDRIPSGALSGTLPWLRVNGTQIATLAGMPVALRGIGLLGLESAPPDPEAGFAAGAGITPATIAGILDWSANVIRVAINRARVLDGSPPWTGWNYLADLDDIIQQASAGGAYTMLSLHRLDDLSVFGTWTGPAGEAVPNHLAPQPDYDTIGLWRLLGERYSEEPGVLFDLYTAPHPRLDDDLSGFDSTWELWRPWVSMMVAELRRVHPRALCFVSGHNWATDLSGFPMPGTEGDPIPNLVYAVHLTPRQNNPWPALRAWTRRLPVVITEWTCGPSDATWAERTADILRGEGLGWVASPWTGAAPLVRTDSGRPRPTAFGAVVRRAIALAGELPGATHPTVPPILRQA
jgi:hypothetical protein